MFTAVQVAREDVNGDCMFAIIRMVSSPART